MAAEPRRRGGGAAALCLALLLAAPARAEPEAAAACTACHGDGASPPAAAEIPVLGGQPELYLLYQLVWFRQGQRSQPEMNALLHGMKDGELRALAAWAAALPPPPEADAAGGATEDRTALVARGRTLAERHRCGICHLPDLSGREHVPRLAGQQEAYLLKALQDYKAGRRIGIQAAMVEVMTPFDEADLEALAAFLAEAGR